jgi:hypothetical protein
MAHAPIPEKIIDELKALHVQSSRVRGSTPLGHPDREAGDELAAKSLAVMETYDVSVSRLSKMMGLSVHTLKFFLMRRGTIPTTPGVAKNSNSTPYRNIVVVGRTGSKDATCKRGHDTSTPDKRTKDGHCKECRSAITKKSRSADARQ